MDLLQKLKDLKSREEESCKSLNSFNKTCSQNFLRVPIFRNAMQLVHQLLKNYYRFSLLVVKTTQNPTFLNLLEKAEYYPKN